MWNSGNELSVGPEEGIQCVVGMRKFLNGDLLQSVVTPNAGDASLANVSRGSSWLSLP